MANQIVRSLADLIEVLDGLTGGSTFIQLTRELAEEILANHPVNRRVRESNVERLKRAMLRGDWEATKSGFMRFLADHSLADGQHRLRAFLLACADNPNVVVIVPVCLVSDTVGVDEGAGRTIADFLELNYQRTREQSATDAMILRSIYPDANPDNRELLRFYEGNMTFIQECTDKPVGWLKGKAPVWNKAFPPKKLGKIRAQLITSGETETEVDRLLEGVVEGGVNLEEGTVLQRTAKQLHTFLLEAFESKRPTGYRKQFQMFESGMQAIRDNKITNIKSVLRRKKKAA